MHKRAILVFAFMILLSSCATKITPQPSPPSPPPQLLPVTEIPVPDTPSDISLDIPPDIPPYIPVDKKDVEEVKKDEITHLVALPKAPESLKEPLRLPDITITNLSLDQKRRLVATLANIGTSPFSMEDGTFLIFVDGQLEKIYDLNHLSKQTSLQPEESITFDTPLTIFGRHEIEARIDTGTEMREFSKENNFLKKILEGLPIGPDIVVKDLSLTEDLELNIILSNNGEADLRKGTTLRFRIFLNDRKVSEFEHFTSEALKAHSKNHYIIDPPYRIGIKGISKVKVSISPKLRSDDIRLENNMIERTFIIFPFRIGAQGREEFSFSLPLHPSKDEIKGERMRIEVRWEGGGSLLILSFKEFGKVMNLPSVSGKSPLKIEFPFGEAQKENPWRVAVINLVEKRVEGYLIVQHP